MIKRVFHVIALVSLASMLGEYRPARAANGADPVAGQIEQARIDRDQARAKARADLMAAFDAQIKACAASGDDAGLKSLLAQKEAFTSAGTLPTSPLIKDAGGKYSQAMTQANIALLDAMDSGVDQYTKAGNFSASLALRTQRRLVAEGRDEAAPAAPSVAGSPDGALAAAKGEYTQTIAEARRSLVASIAARDQSASGAGNLDLVKQLDKLKDAVEAGSDVPEDVPDPAIQAARTRYRQVVRAANARLAVSYNTAIRALTRDHKLDAAESVQAEMNAIGLGSGNSGAAGAAPAASGTAQVDISYKLAELLPPPLVSAGTYTTEKTGGIRPEKHTYIMSRVGTYLPKDFVWEVTFVQAHTNGAVIVGIGEARANGGSGEPEDSTYLRVSPSGGGKGEVLLRKEWWGGGGQGIGRVSEPGEYVARIEKRGSAVTFAVGTVKEGAFTADVSRTVPDIKDFAAFLNDKNAHLFFGGGAVFKQIHIKTGDAGDDSSSVPATPLKLPVAAATPPPALPTPAPAVATPSPAVATPMPAPTTPAPAAPASVTPPAVVPGLSPPAKSAPGLVASIFQGSDFKGDAKRRVDPNVDFTWAKHQSPDKDIKPTHYSVRWTGTLTVPPQGAIGVGMEADDGTRLYLDGRKLIEFHKPNKDFDHGKITPGPHLLQIEYWNTLAEGKARLIWILPGDASEQTVPASALSHDPATEK